MDALPVEMISFDAIKTDHGNLLQWKTASEWNSAYYLIERSTTGYFTENSVIGSMTAAGYSNTIMEYAYLDSVFAATINYYQITQVDNDGAFKTYGPIYVDNRSTKKLVRIIDMMGYPVTNTINLPSGLYIEVYDDGTMKKVYKQVGFQQKIFYIYNI